jgi:hypothetical protein
MSLTRKARRSAKVSLKHAFTAALSAVVQFEGVEEIARLKSSLISIYQPANSEELLALERMALAQQAMLRAARLEATLLNTCIQATIAANDNCRLAAGFLRLARQSNGWSLFLRYQGDAECQYHRAREDFDSLKALRIE